MPESKTPMLIVMFNHERHEVQPQRARSLTTKGTKEKQVYFQFVPFTTPPFLPSQSASETLLSLCVLRVKPLCPLWLNLLQSLHQLIYHARVVDRDQVSVAGQVSRSLPSTRIFT